MQRNIQGLGANTPSGEEGAVVRDENRGVAVRQSSCQEAPVGQRFSTLAIY